MRDVELANKLLNSKEASLVIVKEGKLIFESGKKGIYGLLQAIEELKNEMNDSSVADRVVGRAAALLLAFSHVNEVYAPTLSTEGQEVLKENNIKVQHLSLVPKILDRTGKNICPFEKFSYNIKSQNQAYVQLKKFALNFKNIEK